LISSFRPAVFENIHVLLARISIDASGIVTIALPDLFADLATESVSISKELHAQGASQYVYRVCFLHPSHRVCAEKTQGLYNNQLYAFKRFKDVGSGKDTVSLKQNHDEILMEAKRLAQLGWFHAEFVRRAEAGSVDIEGICGLFGFVRLSLS
jgi:hypothetical protein